MEVEVVRSKKRRKTVSAQVVEGRVRVRIPAWMTKAQEREAVDQLVKRIERWQTSDKVDLMARACSLANRYDLPAPTSIRFVSNQSARWGSCTPSTGDIRISDRVAGFPLWVLDGVIVHELAHLRVLGHNREFRALVDRYPKSERAYGFLIAKEMATDAEQPDEIGV